MVVSVLWLLPVRIAPRCYVIHCTVILAGKKGKIQFSTKLDFSFLSLPVRRLFNQIFLKGKSLSNAQAEP